MFETAMMLMAPQSIHSGTWDEFMKKLKKHYAPVPSRIARHQHFYHRDQAPGESINQYMAVLRKAAQHCEFVNLDNYLLDRLVSGMRDEHLKQRLIVNHELMFQIALDEACAAELATLSIADFLRGHSSPKPKGIAIHFNEAEFGDSDDELVVNRLKETKKMSWDSYNNPANTDCKGCG